MNKNIGIYKITNPSNRVYIGQSKDLVQRFKSYKASKGKNQTVLHNSILKYGLKNHIFSIIENCKIEDLNKRERYWQDYYDVLNGGLNCILTNTEDLPKILSQVTLLKMSESKRGNKNPMFNKKMSDENKELVIKRNKERIVSRETKLKMSKSAKNKIFTNSHRLNIIESAKNRIKSDDEILNLKLRNKKIHSKKVIDISTNEIYDSAITVSNKFNIPYSTLKGKLNINNKIKNNTNFKYFLA